MVMQGNPIAELSEEKRENRKLRKIVGRQNTQLAQKDIRIKALEGVVEAARGLERLYELDPAYFDDRPGTIGYVAKCVMEALKKLEEV